MPRVCGGKQTRIDPVVGLPSEYWKVTVTIPFLDMIISEMNQRFAIGRRVHYELCSLVAEVIRMNKNLKKTSDILVTKWEHLIHSGGDLYGELYVDGSNIVAKYL